MDRPYASVGEALEIAKKELRAKAPDASALALAEAGNLGFYSRAVIGYDVPPGSKDEPRKRLHTRFLTPERGRQLIAMHEQDASDRELQEQYFRCPGSALQIYFGDADFIDFSFRGVDS